MHSLDIEEEEGQVCPLPLLLAGFQQGFLADLVSPKHHVCWQKPVVLLKHLSGGGKEFPVAGPVVFLVPLDLLWGLIWIPISLDPH